MGIEIFPNAGLKRIRSRSSQGNQPPFNRGSLFVRVRRVHASAFLSNIQIYCGGEVGQFTVKHREYTCRVVANIIENIYGLGGFCWYFKDRNPRAVTRMAAKKFPSILLNAYHEYLYVLLSICCCRFDLIMLVSLYFCRLKIRQ